jgi:hypothetical protein
LICDAVRSTVPQEMWGAITDKLDEPQQPTLAFDDETDDVEEVFEPDDYDELACDQSSLEEYERDGQQHDRHGQ